MRVALILLVALLAAVPARAATPVTGSGSLNEAPVIEPGVYSDTILPGEVLFYGVEVGEGERIALEARSSLTGSRFRQLVALLRFTALGPLREPAGLDAEADVHHLGEAAGFEAGPASETSGGPYEAYVGPGTWYISVHAFGSSEQKAEIPFEFALERAGEAGSTPTPTPTPTPTATPAPTPAPADPAEESVDPAAIGAVGMSGLILGLIGGAAAGRRKR